VGSKGSGGGGAGAAGPTFNSELWKTLLMQLGQPQGASSAPGGGGLAGGISRGFTMGMAGKAAGERQSQMTDLERRLRFMEALTQTEQRTGEL